jgi:type III pantothenate kinase
MNLVVDYGNSAAKVGIFNHQNMIEHFTFRSLQALNDFIITTSFSNIIVSSVNADAETIVSWAGKATVKLILNKNLRLPINNLYATPETLGMDRLAAVCGAFQLYPLRNSLVIDAGTCITYDFIDREGNYHGGGISPGLSMRFKAVHTLTAKLPLVSPKKNIKLIGSTTETCIQSGVVNGLLAEIDGIILQYREKFDGLNVILCGGDAGFFENQTKASIFASPELVLIGLNSILIYNVNHS